MASRSLNILCFGDSLTSGFCHFGMDSHPYSIRLEDRLAAAFPGSRIEVFTNGVPGDVVSKKPFKNRLQAELEKRQYDWVIMLGGTNDVGSAISADTAFEALRESWEMVLAKGSKLLALTVPECAVKIGWLDDSRTKLNQNILNHKARNFHTFDLRAHIPYHSLTEDERDDRWDDGLHLSPPGYNWMGNHIADALLPLLQGAEQLAKSKPRTRRPAANADDNLVFKEESGSSKRLSQGYVVVRKKDLD